MNSIYGILIFFAGVFANAEQFHCKQVNGPLGGAYEVILEEKQRIEISDVDATLSTHQKDALGFSGGDDDYDFYSHYKLSIYVGEATPMHFKAVGATADVEVFVLSPLAHFQMNFNLDELGKNDISSTLRVGGKDVQMSCSRVEKKVMSWLRFIYHLFYQ